MDIANQQRCQMINQELMMPQHPQFCSGDSEAGARADFMDADGHPLQQLEWDQNCGGRVSAALAMGYRPDRA